MQPNSPTQWDRGGPCWSRPFPGEDALFDRSKPLEPGRDPDWNCRSPEGAEIREFRLGQSRVADPEHHTRTVTVSAQNQKEPRSQKTLQTVCWAAFSLKPILFPGHLTKPRILP